jgi:uncharacterized protein (UPF0303 family)
MTLSIPSTTATMTPEDIAAQEAALTFPRFTHLDALNVGEALTREGLSRGLPLAIDVYLFERTVYSAALPGSAADNLDWIRRKRNVVLRFGKSSFRIGRERAAKGASLHDNAAISEVDYAAHGGSFPILVEGTGPIGAISVSGLPGHEDHATIIAALTKLRAEA